MEIADPADRPNVGRKVGLEGDAAEPVEGRPKLGGETAGGNIISHRSPPLFTGRISLRGAEKRRRSTRGTSEEDRPGGSANGGGGEIGLPARPDREEDAEDEEADGERQRQEKNGQDHERYGVSRDHLLSPFFFILGSSCPHVNKDGVLSYFAFLYSKTPFGWLISTAITSPLASSRNLTRMALTVLKENSPPTSGTRS
jgi:hypothetical protein